MLKKKIRFPNYLLLLPILLLSCLCSLYPSGEEDEVLPEIPNEYKDFSILSGTPCSPPCWQNLEICNSTYDDVMNKLHQLAFLDSNSIEKSISRASTRCEVDEQEVEMTSLVINCAEPRGRTCARIVIHDDRLQFITLYPNFNLSIGDIVEIYGPPEFVTAEPWGAECPGCDLSLYYPESQVVFEHFSMDCSVWEGRCQPVYEGMPLDPDLRVTNIRFLPYEWLSKFPIEDYGQPWTGFTPSE